MQSKTDTVQGGRKGRREGGREEKGGESVGRYGLTTGTSLTSTCYQQATKRMELQL